jgi:hypothetical protein
VLIARDANGNSAKCGGGTLGGGGAPLLLQVRLDFVNQFVGFGFGLCRRLLDRFACLPCGLCYTLRNGLCGLLDALLDGLGRIHKVHCHAVSGFRGLLCHRLKTSGCPAATFADVLHYSGHAGGKLFDGLRRLFNTAIVDNNRPACFSQATAAAACLITHDHRVYSKRKGRGFPVLIAP